MKNILVLLVTMLLVVCVWSLWGQTYDSMESAYGELFEDNAGGSTINMASSATYYPWVTTTAGVNKTMTLSTANDNIVILCDGEYLVTAQVSFAGSNTTIYTWAVHINDSAATGFKVQRTIGTGTDIGSTSISGIMDLDVGDTLNLEVLSDGTSKIAIVYYAQLTVVILN